MNIFKRIKKPFVKKSKIKLSSFQNGLNLKLDENLTPLTYAVKFYNFSNKSGSLTKGLGLADFCQVLNQPDFSDLDEINVTKVFYSKKFNNSLNVNQDQLGIVSNDLNFYSIPLNSNQTFELTNHIGVALNNSDITAINYNLDGEDSTLISSPNDSLVVWPTENEIYRVIDCPRITSMCVHYERVFATVGDDENTIWFSDDLDPTNWSLSLTEAGFIKMQDDRGGCRKVISFNGYVYVFRDYGIARISAFGDQNQFSVSQLFVSSGKIYANSVVLCGNEVVFLATDGLYKFDGINCVKILDGLTPAFTSVDNQNCCATYFENKYYLACKFNYSDNTQAENTAYNNALIEVDLSKKTAIFMRGVDVKSLTAINCDNYRGVVVCAKKFSDSNYKIMALNQSGEAFGEALTKVWESPLTDLGYPESEKTLCELIVSTKTDITFVIENEKEDVKSFQISGSEKPKKINLIFKFNKLKFKIISNEKDCCVMTPFCLIKLSEV
ncbi:MAG: hypothetical protein K6F08_01795 [bacterium]|nr:hypothetical protein [bacterium]